MTGQYKVIFYDHSDSNGSSRNSKNAAELRQALGNEGLDQIVELH